MQSIGKYTNWWLRTPGNPDRYQAFIHFIGLAYIGEWMGVYNLHDIYLRTPFNNGDTEGNRWGSIFTNWCIGYVGWNTTFSIYELVSILGVC